jgi:hypothetical protein
MRPVGAAQGSRASLLAFFCGVLLATAAAGGPGDERVPGSEPEMSPQDRAGLVEKLTRGVQSPASLFVDPQSVRRERVEFFVKYRRVGEKRRPLYEQYIDVIGANGILDVLRTVSPACHDEAHDLGGVIYDRLKDVAEAIRTCADTCSSGCMHGVVMTAFGEGRTPVVAPPPTEVVSRKRAMNDLCRNDSEIASSYPRGDCAHGVGHALMFLSNYDAPKAVEACRDFDGIAMMYYCVTGIYMEYVNQHDRADTLTKRPLYPCDESPYPAACARYKMVHVARRYYAAGRPTEDLVRECEKLAGKYRLGCFHGLGNAHMEAIGSRRMRIQDVCLHGTPREQSVCIEGAIERMAKDTDRRAREVCEELEGQNRQTCLTAVKNRMYSLDKDLTLYLADY